MLTNIDTAGGELVRIRSEREREREGGERRREAEGREEEQLGKDRMRWPSVSHHGRFVKGTER